MPNKMALKIAIDLMHLPSQVRFWREEPLPDGVLLLLRLAAADREAEETAVALTGRPRATLLKAATFFIEQILFAPDADSYRVLGASPQASSSELRRNLALLLRWLHPDIDPDGERSMFIGRVTTAWNNLKTPERRTEYDKQTRFINHKKESRSAWSKRWAEQKNRNTQFANEKLHRDRAVRNGRFTHGATKIGLLRRVLVAVFHRPLQ